MNDKPIIYDGVEYKDRFCAESKFIPSFWMRVAFVFSLRLTVEHEIFLKEIMPAEKTICHVHIFTLTDWFKGLFTKKQGWMEAPSDAAQPEA